MMIRPSSSGTATFIAVSSGPSPLGLASHCRFGEPLAMAWRIGTFKDFKASIDPPRDQSRASAIANDIVVTRTSISRSSRR